MLKKFLFVLLISLLAAASFGFATEPTSTLTADNKETVVENYEKGYWLYESPDLKVEINRFEDIKMKTIWYEADIKFNKKHSFMPYAADETKIGRTFKYAEDIARSNKLVFAINDDQVGYRIYNHKVIGHAVRDGKILGDRSYTSRKFTLPSLDAMSIDDKGVMHVFDFNEHTGQEYLYMGYKNVYCFGPIIIRDGEINPILDKQYTIKEARMTMGMVEPNHFICISCEGRRERTRGASLKWIGERMKALGVKQAYNFDGGGTTSLIFMGTKLNFFNPTGEVRKDRALSGIIGIGKSDLVKNWEGVGK